MVALTAGARMVAAWGGSSMARGAESALEKIAAVVPEGVRARAERLSLHAWGGIPPDHEIRETIDAIEAATDSRIASTSRTPTRHKASDRVVRPLGLWFWGKVWTLVAWCELRDDFRMFRLDRIAEIDVLDPYTPASRSGPCRVLPQRGRHAPQAVDRRPGVRRATRTFGACRRRPCGKLLPCRPRPLPCSSRRHRASADGQRVLVGHDLHPTG
jgi:predicted DNA-binding transcriptional regulator YafY